MEQNPVFKKLKKSLNFNSVIYLNDMAEWYRKIKQEVKNTGATLKPW